MSVYTNMDAMSILYYKDCRGDLYHLYTGHVGRVGYIRGGLSLDPVFNYLCRQEYFVILLKNEE